MLPILLALFLNFNAGQMQSDYKEHVVTRVITDEANTQEFAHEASVRTAESSTYSTVFTITKPRYSHGTIQLKPIITDVSLPTIIHDTRTIPIELQKTVHAEGSTNAFDIAAPPPKIQLSIAHETMKLKPKISDVISHTINEITQEADQIIGPRVSGNVIRDEGPINVIKAAAPPSEIQLNIKRETIRLQPKISDVITHTINGITQERDQNIGLRASVDEMKDEGPLNVIKVAAPPPKILLNIKHETMELKPKISDVISHTINEITQANQIIGPRVSGNVIRDEGPVNVIKVAAPPPKILLNIKHETMELKPKISDVISHTINEITQADQIIGPRVSGNVIRDEGPVNVIEVAAPPPKIQLNIKHETVRLQPKISDVVTNTINGITEKVIQENAPGANFQGIDETNLYSVKPAVINIDARPPKIQLNITHETIEPKPEITNIFSHTVNEITKETKKITTAAAVHEVEHEEDVPSGGSAGVINTAASKPEVTYERPKIENLVETQPKTFEEPINDEYNNQVAEQPAKLESQAEPDVNALSQPINVGYQVKLMESDVNVDRKTIVDNSVRKSEQQNVEKPPHKFTHKKGAKTPAHAHKKHKRPAKKTHNAPDIYKMQKVGKPPHKSAHKKGTKKPAHAHEKHNRPVKKTHNAPYIHTVNQPINVNYHVKLTSDVEIGRRTKVIHSGMRVPVPGINVFKLPQKYARKNCSKRPTHVHKPKKPMKKPYKVYDVRVEDHTRIRTHGRTIVDNRLRVSGQQKVGKPLHKPAHKKGLKKPAHAHEKHNRPVKKTHNAPYIHMVNQPINVNYHVKLTSDVEIGRRTKVIHSGMRVPVPGINVFKLPQKYARKNCSKRPTHVHKPKKPMKKPYKVYDVRVEDHTRIPTHGRTIVDNRLRVSGQQKVGKPLHKPAHKKGLKKPAHAHEKHNRPVKKTHNAPYIHMVNQPINVNYHVKLTSDVEIGRRTKVIHSGMRVPVPGINVFKLPQKYARKNCSKRPTHVHKPKKPMKKPYKVYDVRVEDHTRIRTHGRTIVDNRLRVSGQQKVGKPLHKPAHKKGLKKPAHAHEKHNRPVKKTHNAPYIHTVNQPINVNYNVKLTSDVEVGRRTKVIYSGTRVPAHGKNVLKFAQKCAHKKSSKRPVHVHKHKKPMRKPHKVFDVRFNDHTKIRIHGQEHFSRPIKAKHQERQDLIIKMKRNRERHPHSSRPKKVISSKMEHSPSPRHFPRPIKTKHQERLDLIIKMKTNRDRHSHLPFSKEVISSKMKHASSPKHGISGCMCKICRAKLARMNQHASLKTVHSEHIRISAHKTDRKPLKSAHIEFSKRPAHKIAHEIRVKKPMTLNNVLAANIKLRHNIRIVKEEKVHLHAKLKKLSPRPVHVLHRTKTVKVHAKPIIVRHPVHAKSIIVRHPVHPKPIIVRHPVHAKPTFVRHPVIARKRIQGMVRHPPTRKRVINACGCKLRIKRHISSHKARYSAGESRVFHANPAADVNVDLRPKRDVAGRLQMSAPMKFVYSNVRYTPSQNHKSHRSRLSGEIKPIDSSHNGVSIATGGTLQFDNWLEFGTCEYMVKRNARTYDNAEMACQALGAHLVSIHSEPENNFIHKITSTGGRIESFEDFVWIGLRKKSQTQWEWVDGSPLDYKKWSVIQPDHSDEKICAQFYQGPANLTHVQEYHWNSFRCDRPMKYYVCKKCKRPARDREHTKIDLRTLP